MVRYARFSFAVMLLVASSSALAADPSLNGVYKLGVFIGNLDLKLGLIKIDKKDGKVEAALVGLQQGNPQMKVGKVTLTGKMIRLDLEPSPGDHSFF